MSQCYGCSLNRHDRCDGGTRDGDLAAIFMAAGFGDSSCACRDASPDLHRVLKATLSPDAA